MIEDAKERKQRFLGPIGRPVQQKIQPFCQVMQKPGKRPISGIAGEGLMTGLRRNGHETIQTDGFHRLFFRDFQL